MNFDTKKTLEAANEFALLTVPRDGQTYTVELRLSGTFVGTVQVQESTDDGATFAAVDVYANEAAVAGNPTAVGNFNAALSATADYVKVICSAYTSGAIVAEAGLIPVSA